MVLAGVAVHGGGHGVRGHAVCDDGVMVDLRPMNGIEIDTVRRRARVQAGVSWGELDAATQPRGLAVTGGRVSSTGVAGFTLGSWVGMARAEARTGRRQPALRRGGPG